MPGRQFSLRHISMRARGSQRKIKNESQKMASACCVDFINPKLIPIKIAFFFIMGATQCVAPYSTLLMKALGLTLEETAIIFTFGPFIPIIAPFIAGILTDRIGNFRKFLIAIVFLSGILSLIHIGIPPARTKIFHNEKDDIKFELFCENKFRIQYLQPEKCLISNQTVHMKNLNASNCGYLCSPPAIEMDLKIAEKAKNATMMNYHNDTYGFNCELGTSPDQKCYANNLNETTTVTNSFTLRDASFYFTEENKIGQVVSVLLTSYMMAPLDVNTYDCELGRLSSDVAIRKLIVSTSSDNANSGPEYVKCKFHCEGKFEIKSLCNNTSKMIVGDVKTSFWLFMFAKMLSSFMIGLTYSMFEAGVVAILKENSYNYGIQRVYGSVGGMVFAPVTGFLIDYFGKGHYSDYYLAFYFYCCVKIFCSLILVKLELNFRTPSKNICGNITNICSNIEIFLLIIVVFVSGMCYGFIEHFQPWYVKDLGAENWVIGLMTTVASFAAIPFLILSDFLCRKFGYVQCIAFGLICYSIRCLGYSLLKNPYWCFPFEVVEGITTGLLVASAIIYGAKLSEQSNLGTLQGILATFHYGFGKSAGSLLGGFLMGRLGGRIAFRIFSGGSFVFAFVYYLIFKLIFQPRWERAEKRKRDVSNMQVEIVPKEDLNISGPGSPKDDKNKGELFPITSTPIKKSSVYPSDIIKNEELTENKI